MVVPGNDTGKDAHKGQIAPNPGSPADIKKEHSYDFVDQRTNSSGGARQPQLRECNPFLRRSCRTAAELPQPELPDGRRSCQLSSRSTIPFSSMSRFNMDFRESRPKFLSPNSSQPWPR
ncbi:unnamed protein product [Boreogadus saida]